MTNSIHILIIEDSEDDIEMFLRRLSKDGFDVSFRHVSKPDDLEEAFQEGGWDVILCDYFLPGVTWQEVLQSWAISFSRNCPLILTSGITDFDSALEAMHQGASDFISKADLSRLSPVIRRELEKTEIRRQKERAEAELKDSNLKLKLALKSLKNIQDQMIAVERFRALGEMASGIAHDFNNALMILQGSVEEIESQRAAPQEIVRKMRTQIDDAASVVRRLKDFYRTSPASEETAVDIDAVLQDVKEFTKPKWEKTVAEGGESVVVEIGETSESFVWADPSKLREIITNLIFNSCDAMQETAGKITLSTRSASGFVEIRVEDTGPGMTPEVKARCLEPLYSTKGPDGTGLGLSIVSAVVQSFGGKVLIESEPGEGTVVSLYLRRAEISELPEPSCHRSISEQRPVRVLVVDDEPVISRLLTKQLSSLGHKASSLTNPLDVTKVMETEWIDLVLTDRSMPEMSGDNLAKLVKALNPETKVLMATGFGDLMIAKGETPEGVDLIVPKPISLEVIVDSLEALFPVCPDSVALSG